MAGTRVGGVGVSGLVLTLLGFTCPWPWEGPGVTRHRESRQWGGVGSVPAALPELKLGVHRAPPLNPLALPRWCPGGAGTRAILPALPCAAHHAHSKAGSLLLPAIFIRELAKYPAKIAKPLSAPGKFG